MKKNNRSISEKVKQLRQQKAWSQSHLAEAAGLSTRTVQRLENTGNCSNETLLCIAAAFDIDIEDLKSESFKNGLEKGQEQYLRKFSPKVSFISGLILMIPGALFVISNVLKYEMGLPWLYDSLVSIGQWFGVSGFFAFFTNPFFLLSSLCIAFILGILSQVRVIGESSGKEFTLRGFQFSFQISNSLVLLASAVVLTILIGYAALENLSDWVVMFLNNKV